MDVEIERNLSLVHTRPRGAVVLGGHYGGAHYRIPAVATEHGIAPHVEQQPAVVNIALRECVHELYDALHTRPVRRDHIGEGRRRIGRLIGDLLTASATAAQQQQLQ